eukprot:SAG31_NODE_208_length_20313_cov_6.143119_1_plen_157_part_00
MEALEIAKETLADAQALRAQRDRLKGAARKTKDKTAVVHAKLKDTTRKLTERERDEKALEPSFRQLAGTAVETTEGRLVRALCPIASCSHPVPKRYEHAITSVLMTEAAPALVVLSGGPGRRFGQPECGSPAAAEGQSVVRCERLAARISRQQRRL